MAGKVPNVPLSNGHHIPIFGLGTWKSKPGEVTEAVKEAIDAGYRHFDCAYVYGNEAEVGAGLCAKMDAGVVKREDLFVTSKLWNTFHSPGLVESALRESLRNLGLTYLDLYLIHWPMGYEEGGELFPRGPDGRFRYSNADYVDTWGALERCVDQGLVRSLGLSNFNSQQIERVLQVAHVKPVVLQVECNPYLNQKKLIEFCKKKNIVVTGYSPLGSPDSPFLKPETPRLLEDPKLLQVAQSVNKSAAQVVLRWMVQRGVVTIPKSVSPTRICHNIEIFDFELSAEDISYLDSLDCGGRLCSLDHAINHPHYPFNIEF